LLSTTCSYFRPNTVEDELYYLFPARFSHILVGKNVAALIIVAAELTVIVLASAALRMPFSLLQVAEAYAVTMTLSVNLLAMGNLSSVYYPAGVLSGQSWRPSSPARFRAVLFVLHPLGAAPVALPFLARWAFAGELAFRLVLAVGAVFGMVVYGVALPSATQAACRRKEQILTALGESRGVVYV